MKEIVLDENVCIGCGACIACAGNNFDFDNEKGISKVISNENAEGEEVAQAISSCPVGAISISEQSEQEAA